MSNATDLVRSHYEAMAAGDPVTALQALTPQTTWQESAGWPYTGTFRGPQQVMESVLGTLQREWDGFAAIPDQFVTEGETVVVLGTYQGTNKQTGRPFQARFAHIWRTEGDQIVGFEQISDTHQIRVAML